MPTARDLAVKYTSRPSCCRACGEPAWWNGTRVVAPVRRSPEGRVEHEPETVRHRARCSSKSCPLGSWTVYEQNDYPHRVFQLDVVVAARGARVGRPGRPGACSARSPGSSHGDPRGRAAAVRGGAGPSAGRSARAVRRGFLPDKVIPAVAR